MDFVFLTLSPILAYLAIVLGMSVEAMITVFAAAFAVTQGSLGFWPVLLSVVFGALLEQQIWYYIGRHLHRFEKFVGFLHKMVGRFDNHFLEKPFKVMLLSKFVYGLHRTALLRFGVLKFPMKQYIGFGFLSVVIWLSIFGTLAYVFSSSYQTLLGFLKYGELVLLGIFCLFFLFSLYVSKKFKKL